MTPSASRASALATAPVRHAITGSRSRRQAEAERRMRERRRAARRIDAE
jgi:hypothetical protein